MKIRYLKGEKFYVYDYSQFDIMLFPCKKIKRVVDQIYKAAEKDPDAYGKQLYDVFFALRYVEGISNLIRHVDGYKEKIVYDGDIRNENDKTFFERIENIENGIRRNEARIKEAEAMCQQDERWQEAEDEINYVCEDPAKNGTREKREALFTVVK